MMARETALRIAAALAVVAIAAPLHAANRSSAERFTIAAPMEPNGTLEVRNDFGSVTVVAIDRKAIEVVAVRRVEAGTDEMLARGRAETRPHLGGDSTRRKLITFFGGSPFDRRWSSQVDYVIGVPRTARVEISTHISRQVITRALAGPVVIKNFIGNIAVEDASGPVHVETVNGTIRATFRKNPEAEAFLSSVNGEVEVRVPEGAEFTWAAETLKGDVLSTRSLDGSRGPKGSGFAFDGVVGRGGPRLRTMSVTGRTYLLFAAAPRTQATSLIPQIAQSRVAEAAAVQGVPGHDWRDELRELQRPKFALDQERIDGDLRYKTSLGNIRVGQITGNAVLATGGGEISLGSVAGTCEANSFGGPIDLGEMNGRVDIRTAAGDVVARSVRRGGRLVSEGGNVQVLFGAGALTLQSGGGNVTLQQGSGFIAAEARNGDVSISLDTRYRVDGVQARADGGNVFLNIPEGFGMDLDAQITTAVDRNNVHAEFPGLNVTRERVDDRTVIRVTGKINGGGPVATLRAVDGDIVVRARSISQTYTPKGN